MQDDGGRDRGGQPADDEARRRQDAEERRLLHQIATGRMDVNSATAELLRSFRQDVLKFFKFRGLSVSDAEDQTQNVLVKVWESAGTFRGDAMVRTWVLTVARNSLYDFWRSRKRQPLDPDGNDELPHVRDESPTVDAALDQHSWEDCYRREFARFAQDHTERAEAIRRQVVDGWSTQDIADFLGRTPGAARQFLAQSKLKLEQYLDRCREFREAVFSG